MDFSFKPAMPPILPSVNPHAEPPIQDEVLKDAFNYHVLQMANKYYAPSHLAYRYTRYGEDQRIKYMAYFLDVRGQRVMEIGPYEGHHSVILEKMGVRELLLVEPRDINVTKCRRIIEKYRLDHTSVVQQDIERIYNGFETAQFSGPFDLVFCAGLLYHIPNPAQALQWMRSMSPRLFLATLYYDPAHPACAGFPRATLTREGKTYQGATYPEAGDPLAGMSTTAFWPQAHELVKMVADAGYTKVHVLGKEIQCVQNGKPHITILAECN